jgi:hypothetical protein
MTSSLLQGPNLYTMCATQRLTSHVQVPTVCACARTSVCTKNNFLRMSNNFYAQVPTMCSCIRTRVCTKNNFLRMRKNFYAQGPTMGACTRTRVCTRLTFCASATIFMRKDQPTVCACARIRVCTRTDFLRMRNNIPCSN